MEDPASSSLVFGFVQNQTVLDLQDIGNWKSRASAIDSLHRALRDVGDKAQLLPSLPKFVAFLVTLVADPNFKIAISSMQILSDLVGKVEHDIEPHLRSIVPNLLEKFTDNKALVRSANFEVLRNLVTACQPEKLVDLLGAGMLHPNWRVREEVTNSLIMVMLLPGSRFGLNYVSIFRLLCQAIADPKERVKAGGLEGMAVLASCAGKAQVSTMLTQASATLGGEACALVNARLANPALPTLGNAGVLHVMERSPDVLDSISTDLPPTRRPVHDLHSLPQQHPHPQPLSSGPVLMGGSGVGTPWEGGPPKPRPRLRPENVQVKHSVGLDGLGPTGPLSANANGGAQVSPTSSQASPVNGAGLPPWSRAAQNAQNSNNIKTEAWTVGSPQSPVSLLQGGAKDEETRLFKIANGSNSVGSFGRYVSSNLKAHSHHKVLTAPQQQQQLLHESSVSPEPVSRQEQLNHGKSLASLGNLHASRGINSLPVGVLGAGREGDVSTSMTTITKASPPPVALSATFSASPPPFPPPHQLSQHTPHPPSGLPATAGSGRGAEPISGALQGILGRPRPGVRSPQKQSHKEDTPSPAHKSEAEPQQMREQRSSVQGLAALKESSFSRQASAAQPQGAGAGEISNSNPAQHPSANAALAQLRLLQAKDHPSGSLSDVSGSSSPYGLPSSSVEHKPFRPGPSNLLGQSWQAAQQGKGVESPHHPLQASTTSSTGSGGLRPPVASIESHPLAAASRVGSSVAANASSSFNFGNSILHPVPPPQNSVPTAHSPVTAPAPPQPLLEPNSNSPDKQSSCYSMAVQQLGDIKKSVDSSKNNSYSQPQMSNNFDAASYLGMLHGKRNGGLWGPEVGAAAQPLHQQSPRSSLSATLRPSPITSNLDAFQQPLHQQAAAALKPLWLHGHQMEDEAALRPETFSPNKVELLANLKRRQIEKRAPSSQLPSRTVSSNSLPDFQLYPSSKSHSGVLQSEGGDRRPSDHRILSAGQPAHRPQQQPPSQWDPQPPNQHEHHHHHPNPQQQHLHQGLPPWIGPQLEGVAGTAAGTGSSRGQGGVIETLKSRGRGMLRGLSRGSRKNQGGGEHSGRENGESASEGANVLTAAQLGLQRISTHRAPHNGNPALVPATSAPAYQDHVPGPGSGSGPPPVSSNSASPMYAQRTRLTPAFQERLRLRSADLPTPGGASFGSTAAAQQHALHAQPSTPTAEDASCSPLTSHKSVSSMVQQSGQNNGNFWEKSLKPMEELTTSDLTPLPEPERSLRAAIAKMVEANNADRKQLDWQGQHDALNDSRRIVAHHPEVLRPCLHEFVRAAVPALDQLRSVTVKNAITLMQEMFIALGRQLDRELDDIVPMLLKKAGEISNAGRENFLAAEADRALSEMCRRSSEHRAIAVLCGSANHKSTHVRAKVGYHLDSMLLEHASARSMLNSNQQCLDRLFKVAAGFLDEGALETRTFGKRILFNIKACLDSRSDLDRLLSLVHPDMLTRKAIDVLDNLQSLPSLPASVAARGGSNLGLPKMPLSRQASGGSGSMASFDSAPYLQPSLGSGGLSAGGGVLSGHALQDAAAQQQYSRGKQSISAPIGGAGGSGPPKARGLKGPASRGGSRGHAAPATAGAAMDEEGGPNALSRTNSIKSSLPGDSGVQDALGKVLSGLSARDFRERIEVLKSLEAMAKQNSPSLACAQESQLVELLDCMTARITDGNAKVSIQALETLGAMFLCIRGRCSVGINTLVPALAATLGSSNDKIRAGAIGATDSLVGAVDPVLLIQNFSHCASHSSLRGRPLLVEKLLVLARALWPARPTLVIKHALPAAFALLNDTKGDGKAAANALLAGLAQLMGPQLIDHTAGLQPALRNRVEAFLR